MSEQGERVELGLANVIAVETALSRVDGARGELVIAGFEAEEFAQTHSFEQAAAHLWQRPLREVRDGLLEGRSRALERPATVLEDPMDTIRATIAAIPTTGSHIEDAYAVTSAIPVAIARWATAREDRGQCAPGARDHASGFLAMLGIEPTDDRVAALSRYLVTVSDHGMNASTFAARVITSTRSDLPSAVTGAVGALKGPLHGGAPGPVLDMLDAIGAPDRAQAWLQAELQAGRRIMGMGHRVYRTRDPRAAVFEKALADFDFGEGAQERLGLARAVERAATEVLAQRYPERDLRANVEFYTAVLLEAIGIPRELFSSTFAVGRVLGWAAHVMEQAREDRLIRPRSRYVGDISQASLRKHKDP